MKLMGKGFRFGILLQIAIRMIFHRSAPVTQHELIVVPSELPGSK